MLKGYKTNNMTSFNIQYSNFKNSLKIRKTKIGVRDCPRHTCNQDTCRSAGQKQARPVLGSDEQVMVASLGNSAKAFPRRSQTTNNILSTASYQTYVSTFFLRKTVMELIISNFQIFKLTRVSNKVENRQLILIVQRSHFPHIHHWSPHSWVIPDNWGLRG